VIELYRAERVHNTTERISKPIQTSPYRKFHLYLDIDSTSTPTDLRVKVQFRNPNDEKWYTYKQGPFASLYWEDQDTASGIQESFSGDCAGREMRLTLTGSGTTSSAYFDVSAYVEFYS